MEKSVIGHTPATPTSIRFAYNAQTDQSDITGVRAVITRLKINDIVVINVPPYHSARKPAGKVDIHEPAKNAPLTQPTWSSVQL